MPERRTSTRRKEFLEARIFFNNRKSGFNCVVHDFSARGARITVSEGDRVPDEFELYVPVKQKAFPARVRWRRDGEIGLFFSQAPPPEVEADSAGDLHKRVAQMEREILALRQEVNALTSELRALRA